MDSGALSKRAEVEPIPATASIKGVLRRTVQLLKRHRDVAFLREDIALAPVSIIITTLASQAYEWCIANHTCNNELDLLCDTIRAMPWFIEIDRCDRREALAHLERDHHRRELRREVERRPAAGAELLRLARQGTC